MAEKAVWALIAIPALSVFVIGGQRVFGVIGAIIGACLGGLLSALVWQLIEKFRVISFKRKRGDFDSLIHSKKQAGARTLDRMAETAEKSRRVTEGAIRLAKDVSMSAIDTLEQRSNHGTDSPSIRTTAKQDEVAIRLETLADLHDQKQISDEEFSEQRSRILNEI